MASSPLAELSSSKAASQSEELRLFPLKSGPTFAGGANSTGASGIIFTGSTLEAGVYNDPFSCCSSYTLRNSVHAAVAAVTSDKSIVFAAKSVVDNLPCFACGAFDLDGKPRELTSEERYKLRIPLLSFSEKLSSILGSDPAVLGVQARSGDSSYGFKTKMTNSEHIFILNKPDSYTTYHDPHHIFEYENHVAGSYSVIGDPAYERSSNFSVEHDGHQVSNASLGASLRQDARSISANVSQGPTSRAYNAEAKNGDFSASLGRRYENKERTDMFGVGRGQTNMAYERSTGGRRSEKISHRIDKLTIEVSRTRDRQNGTDYRLQFNLTIPMR